MDNFLLEAVTRELSERREPSGGEGGLRIVGRRLAAVRQLASGGLLLILEQDPPFLSNGRSILVIETSPGRERLHLARAPLATLRSGPTGFAASAAHALRGTLLTEIRKDPSERAVELIFGMEGRIVAELIERASNILLLDGRGIVLACARRLESAFRRAEIGRPYEKPVRPPSDGRHAGVFEATEELVGRIAEEAGRESRPLSSALREALIGLPAVVAGDIERLQQLGEAPFVALRRWLEALRSGVFRPTLYSRGEPEALPLDRFPAANDLFALPIELAAPLPELVATSLETVNEAAEALYRLKGRALDFVRRREGWAAILRREASRLARLRCHLRADLQNLDPPGVSRRQAEAILAGLSRARREGDYVVVPDPYCEPGHESEVRVKIDPARSLQDNGAALFRKEAKAGRARVIISKRLALVGEREAALESFSAELSAVRDPEALARTESAASHLGLVLAPQPRLSRVKPPKGERAAAEASVAPSPPRLAGIRRYVSSDGFEILVGKSGRENQRLTFQMAAAEDFWLHAAGVAGAHVVVRNPARFRALPERTLREAARLAALYSGASRQAGPSRSGRGKVEVHISRRKHVRKARGAPAGTVLLRRFTSMLVEPGEPPVAEEI